MRAVFKFSSSCHQCSLQSWYLCKIANVEVSNPKSAVLLPWYGVDKLCEAVCGDKAWLVLHMVCHNLNELFVAR